MSVIDRLDKLAWWLAHRHRDSRVGHMVKLSTEDIHQELMTEVVVATIRYSDLSKDELYRVAKTCMYNRMKDMLREEYGSYRGDMSFASEEFIEYIASDATPSEWIDLKVELQRLSNDTARAIVDMLLNGSDRLTFELLLADMRRAHVYKKGRYKLTIKPFMLARALGVALDEVMTAIDEIKDTLRQ